MAETKKKPLSATAVKGGIARFSYAKVFKPEAMDPDDPDSPKKYSVAILWPKSDKALTAAINKAVKAALEDGKTKKFAGKIPATWKNPVRDGDERTDDPVYAGHWYINATNTKKPGVVDINRDPISPDDADGFYSGCYGRFLVNFFAFNTKGNKGVGASLQHLQKTRDGERLAGGISADEAFDDDWTDDSDDAGGEDDDLI